MDGRKLKSIAKPAPGATFNTHHLDLEENWYVREHPFDIRVAKVKSAVKVVDDLEQKLTEARESLEAAVSAMNAKRKENGQ